MLVCAKKSAKTIQYTNFNLSGGCFGTDIIQKYTKWSQLGIHGLLFGPIFAKFQCVSFLLKKMLKNDNMVQQNTKM